MGSGLFLFELLSAYEPENRKCLVIKETIFRFMGREHLQNPDVNRGHEPAGELER